MQRYRDYNTYLRGIFGERVQKISLDAGLGCPNRDGTISRKGCIYCDRRGSGTGELVSRGLSIDEQIENSKALLRKRYRAGKFIAYFQSFSNTYAPLQELKSLYDRALSHADVVGLAVATRPDCVNQEIIELLAAYSSSYLVWVEYGLQSCHDQTLELINRGHDAERFVSSVRLTHSYGLPVCAHVILGLPGEDQAMMLRTADFLADLRVEGIKIHLLYVLQGTPLAELYQNRAFRCLEQREYVELVVRFLERLPPDTIVQRLTGDPVPTELLAPQWATEKSRTLNLIQQLMETKDTWQGRERGVLKG